MKTRKSNEFFSSLQQYIFVRPDANINPETDLPDDSNDYRIVDADDLACIGVPMDGDEEFSLWAILEPGETVPK
jgi:hypothetical protein